LLPRLDRTLWLTIPEEISAAPGARGAVLLQSGARTIDVARAARVRDMLDHYFAVGWHTRDPIQLRARYERGGREVRSSCIRIGQMTQMGYDNAPATRHDLASKTAPEMALTSRLIAITGQWLQHSLLRAKRSA
jgi:hypothetical protein